jgi:ketosteroid isomerase-like protein
MIALLLPLMLAAASAEMPHYPDLPPDLAAAAEAFDRAQVEGDGAALDRLLADDYLLVNSQGQTETKAEFIRDYTAPGFSFAPFTIQKPVEKVWATGAVLGGVVDAKGTSGGKPYAFRMRFADVWAKRDGKWQVIYTQARRALPGE